MRQARHVLGVENRKQTCKAIVRRREKKKESGDIGEDGRLILKWILQIYCVTVQTGLTLFIVGSNRGILAHGNKTSCFIKCGKRS
jgi:hypothetical protein